MGFSSRLNWPHAARVSPGNLAFVIRMAAMHNYSRYLIRIIDPLEIIGRAIRFGIGVGKEFCPPMRNARVTPVAGYGLLLRSLPVLRRQRYINIAATHRNTPSQARSDCRWCDNVVNLRRCFANRCFITGSRVPTSSRLSGHFYQL